ncbi:MAG: NUDIX hydrolase [Saprospiraceae bacterium]|nr:NUDIX hydrolase [Saprospiraceae bacterium]
MSNPKWKFKQSVYGEDLRMFRVRKDAFSDGTHEFIASVLEGHDSANVVALTADLEVVMVDIFRFGSRERSLEIPGGMVDAGEDPLHAAQRELREETGYQAIDWSYLGYCYSNPVFMNSKVHHFIAYQAQPIVSATPEVAEDIQIQRIPYDTLAAQAFHLVRHPHTLSALGRALLLNPEIQV